MKAVNYYNESEGCGVTVEEMTRKEILSYIADWFDTFRNCDFQTDMTIYVEYKDGSHYYKNDDEEDGTFKKTNIKGAILDDGYEYYICGAYTFSENMIPELA